MRLELRQVTEGRGETILEQRLELQQILRLQLLLDIDHSKTVHELLADALEGRLADRSTSFSERVFPGKGSGFARYLFRMARLRRSTVPLGIAELREHLASVGLQMATIKELVYCTRHIPAVAFGGGGRRLLGAGSVGALDHDPEQLCVPYASSSKGNWRYGVEPVSVTNLHLGSNDFLLLRRSMEYSGPNDPSAPS